MTKLFISIVILIASLGLGCGGKLLIPGGGKEPGDESTTNTGSGDSGSQNGNSGGDSDGGTGDGSAGDSGTTEPGDTMVGGDSGGDSEVGDGDSDGDADNDTDGDSDDGTGGDVGDSGGDDDVVTPDIECDEGDVAMCHIPQGDPEDAHMLCVGESSVDKHLLHGDCFDTCNECL